MDIIIKIIQFFGYYRAETTGFVTYGWKDPQGRFYNTDQLPNYCRDWSKIQEGIKKLPLGYTELLRDLEENILERLENENRAIFELTPRDLAEEFLFIIKRIKYIEQSRASIKENK